MTHRIRLRGAWQTSLSNSATVESPVGWEQFTPSQFCGEISFRRVFHAPSGLAESTRVELVIPPIRAAYQLVLNDDIILSFHGIEEGRIEIAKRIQRTNHLLLRVKVLEGERAEGRSLEDLHICLEIGDIGDY